MTDFASSLTRTIARQYDLFQASLEYLQKDRKFLNYGYTVSGKETYEERQERLCLEVFQAAEIGQGDVVIDVGFGSGEQDFLLSNTCEFSRLVGFNISERQVRYANERAIQENVAHKLSFRLGEAERLAGCDVVIYQRESRKRRSFAGASASWPLGVLTARGEEVLCLGIRSGQDLATYR